MDERSRVQSGSPYEPIAGFCRALRQGDRIEVAGTAPLGPDGQTVAPGEAGPQTRRCLEIIRDALRSLGADLEDVVRTRLYVTRAEDFDDVARVHGEFFAGSRPVTTCVVTGLLDPAWRVEIEAEALLSLRVRPLREDDREWLRAEALDLFGADVVISRGVAHPVTDYAGFVAVHGGERRGLATYLCAGDSCELVTLDAFARFEGVGTLLMAAVEEAARAQGCQRLWLITTNDNLEALRFYQRRGYRLTRLHAGAVDEVSRPLKPAIPVVGNFGIALRDELELEREL